MDHARGWIKHFKYDAVYAKSIETMFIFFFKKKNIFSWPLPSFELKLGFNAKKI